MIMFIFFCITDVSEKIIGIYYYSDIEKESLLSLSLLTCLYERISKWLQLLTQCIVNVIVQNLK